MNIVTPYYEKQLSEQAAEKLVDEACHKWKKVKEKKIDAIF